MPTKKHAKPTAKVASSAPIPRGKIAMRAGAANHNGLPNGKVASWKPHLDMYDDVRALRFASPEEFAQATEILWSDELRDLPCDIAPYNTIMVPADAVPYFKRLKFTETDVLSPNDIPPEELAEIRRENGPY